MKVGDIITDYETFAEYPATEFDVALDNFMKRDALPKKVIIMCTPISGDIEKDPIYMAYLKGADK